MYHSVHDNFYYEANLTDPTFSYHTTVGLVWGKVALMLATSPVLPYDPRHYSTALSDILSGLKEKYETVLTKHNISLGKYSYTHSLSLPLSYNVDVGLSLFSRLCSEFYQRVHNLC